MLPSAKPRARLLGFTRSVALTVDQKRLLWAAAESLSDKYQYLSEAQPYQEEDVARLNASRALRRFRWQEDLTASLQRLLGDAFATAPLGAAATALGTATARRRPP
mmetsp:Transcript_23225/g.48330  ORF Transcript_23225/g.48330 Transcript_23225/m.48330 type:complete len:106 (-) Transcript_23225:194-511(-)